MTMIVGIGIEAVSDSWSQSSSIIREIIK